jgi:hypothetical protein
MTNWRKILVQILAPFTFVPPGHFYSPEHGSKSLIVLLGKEVKEKDTNERAICSNDHLRNSYLLLSLTIIPPSIVLLTNGQ